MGMHDQIALKARAMGKSSAEFKKAAQSNANMTWFWLLVAGGVWYFTDWVWALIPAGIGAFSIFRSISATMTASKLEAQESQPQPSTSEDASAVVNAYGKVLENKSPMPGSVADSSELPYPKDRIKAALITALKATTDTQTKEHLKIAYIQLADWQEGVGSDHKGLDVSKIDQSQDVEKLAEQVLAMGSDSEEWTKRSQKEGEELKGELQKLGLWSNHNS